MNSQLLNARRSGSWIGFILLAVFMTIMVNASGAFAEDKPYSEGTSNIYGKVVDAETGEPLIGVTVTIEETFLGAFTDLDGNFRVKKVPFGYYTVKASMVGYESAQVTDVVVTADQNTTLNIIIKPANVEIEGIKVTAKAVENTAATVLLKRKSATAVSDGISSEEISRSGSGDAAEAMTKVTGASVVGGKYVYVRGLGDRYANTNLNGSALPSPDPDQQAVPMDLIPTSLLDNIVVEKTFTPDKPGNFAGGSVDLGTKDYPENRSLNITMSSGYDSEVTGNDILTHDGSETDWAGYDNGKREIPAYITSNPDLQAQVPEGTPLIRHTSGVTDYDSVAALAYYMDQSSRAFSTEMAPKSKKAPVNQSYSVSYGDQWQLFNRPLGIISSMTYSRKYKSYSDGFSGKYKLSGAGSSELTIDHEMDDSQSVEDVLWGGMLNVKYGIGENHKIGANYMVTQNGESETRYLYGDFPEHVDPGEWIQTRALLYTERNLQTVQLNGEHLLPLKIRAEWQASYAKTDQEEPDNRYFINQVSPVYVEDPDSGDLVPLEDSVRYAIYPGRFPVPERDWRKLEETNNEYKADFTLPLSRKAKFKTGASYLDKDRTNRERKFSYIASGGFDGNPDDYASSVGLIRVDTAIWQTDTTIFFKFDNVITEEVELRNQYDGYQKIFGTYGMLELPLLKKLDFVGGVRYENTDMYSVTWDENYAPGEIKSNDYLPSASFIYKPTNQMNVRVAYGKTLARPNLREMSPFTNQEFAGARLYSGNAKLTYTKIDNYDVRWEWFLRPGEVVAISGFYKNFKNPIELTISDVNGNLTWKNVDKAEVYGVELEFRRNMSHAFNLLRNFNIGGNLTLVKSIVEIPQFEQDLDVRETPETERPLAGQSPYIINLDLSFNNLHTGTNMSLYYNVFGERLTFNATNGTPDVYEQPRNQLDFLASQRIFGEGGPKLKLSVKNILGEDARFVHENIGLPAQKEGKEFVYAEYKRGTTVSLGISYSVW